MEDANQEVLEVTIADGNVIKVDKDDLELLGEYTWRVRYRHGVGYVGRRTWNKGRTKQLTILLHRQIMNAPESMTVDHIDGDPLNNSKSNLRLASHADNCRNRGPRRDSTSGYKGVTWRNDTQKWRAQVGRYTLGSFDNKHDAARMYNFWARDLYGEYARLNVIKDEEETA